MSRGYLKTIDFEKFLWPALENLKDFNSLKGSYFNFKDLKSTILEIIICDKKYHGDCEEESKIRTFLKSIYMTQYFLKE